MFTLGYCGFTRNTRPGKGIRSPFAKTNQDFENIFSFREGEVPFSMFPLGYFGHDASACLLLNGEVIACASEERFTRIKHSLNLAGNTLLPRHSINYCLQKANITIKDVDLVAHYCKFTRPIIRKRAELLRPYIPEEDFLRVNQSYQIIYDGMMNKKTLLGQFEYMTGEKPKKFIQVPHHKAHAASAFYPSGFDKSVILTIDGTGELESSLFATGNGNSIETIQSAYIPTSLGALYLIITVFLGFRTLDDEYKVMGLASYGNPEKYRKFFKSLVTLGESGKYSTEILGKPDFKELLLKNLGAPGKFDEPFSQNHADIAASLQETLNETVMHTLKHISSQTGIRKLCMAGGVALNSTMNGVIARSGLFDDIFIQPAASDEGCCAGAALYAYTKTKKSRLQEKFKWEHVYWGPEYSPAEILNTLDLFKDKIRWVKKDDIAASVAFGIANGKVVGWFQGRMEFGPRALGNRSILADPRDPDMKDRINKKVKRRELFRPFAPAVLEEEANEYFDMTGLYNSPFMLFVVPVKEKYRSVIPAVTHVDGTSRIQTVSKKTNLLFHKVLTEFKKLTAIPVILNTSFNVRNEPIVCSPKDAINCFMSTDIDCIAIGNYYIEKRNI
ncbi:MAG: nodulation protein [Ignavibacteriae bacterium]|nr:nodulation protein [Ignavibacteriota bacterium]